MFCRSCKYPLAQVSSRNCPECGREFDCANPETYVRSLPSARLEIAKTVIRHTIAWIFLVMLASVTIVAWMVEQYVPISALAYFLPSVITIFTLFIALFWFVTQSRTYVLILLAMMILLVSLHFIEFSPQKRFMRLYSSLHAGMTLLECRALVDEYFPADGKWRHPVERPISANQVNLILDPTDGRFNAEWIRVLFDDHGICTDFEYVPD